MARSSLLLFLGPALLSGCPTPCSGADCEQVFDSALLGLIRGGELSDSPLPQKSPLDTWMSVEGRAAQGPDWDLALVPGLVVAGSARDSRLRVFNALRSDDVGPGAHSAVISGQRSTDGFGAVVIDTPDLNGDGERDFAVGAPLRNFDTEHRHNGSVYLLPGPASAWQSGGVAPLQLAQLSTLADGAELGGHLAACGDLDGDGLAELLVGASLQNQVIETSGGRERYRAAGEALLLDSSTMRDLTEGQPGRVLLPEDLRGRWWGHAPGMRLGVALACADDLVGDAGPDLLIGAPFYGEFPEANGVVYIIDGAEALGEGRQGGTAESRAAGRLEGLEANAWAGWSLATGDLSGDGLADIAVGAPGVEGRRGMVMVWNAAPDGDGQRLPFGDRPPDLRILGEEEGDGLGESLAIADVNADGLQDLLIGAPHTNPRGNDSAEESGAVYLFFGSPDFASWRPFQTAEEADLRLEVAQQFLRTGRVLRVGDTDGDGAADLGLIHRVRAER